VPLLTRTFSTLVVALAGLLVPSGAAARGSKTAAVTQPGVLEVPHEAPGYFYPPKGKGKKKPVIVWLHGRGANPESDCRKWSKVVTEIGWLLCPSGPENRGGGGRGWNNSWPSAKRAVDNTMAAFHARFGKLVRTKGHILIGFSEGALAAMNIGVREPEMFNRWLIIAANDNYWGMDGLNELKKNKKKLKRIYLLTGEKDGVVENTRRVHASIEREGVPVRIWTPEDIGHEVPADRMRTFYRKPLRWLAAAR
jgi:predicted esterase